MLGVPVVSNPTSIHPAVMDMRRRLDRFYASTNTYPAFQQAWVRDNLYDLVADFVDHFMKSKGRLRVLELGAGTTGYPDYLKRRGIEAAFDAQDVTSLNVDYLRLRCREVFICDIAEIPTSGHYDIVISTFVFEHVSNPSEFLEHVDRLLAPGGWHLLFCPRYDLPGYLCPSLRHLSPIKQKAMMMWLSGSRLMAWLDRRPRFWVNCEPSVLHGPWFRDADAVHLVSRMDVERWHRTHGFEVRRLYPPYRGLAGLILHRLLTLNLACRKHEPKS